MNRGQNGVNSSRECIPTKILPKSKNLPWLSKGLVNWIKQRNLLNKQEKYQEIYPCRYKLMRNKVTCDLRKAKKSYFQKINP